MGANTSDADKLQGLGRGRGRGRGSSLLVKQRPNDAGSVVWGDFYFDTAAAGGVDSTIATSQGQGTSLTTDRTVSGSVATLQAQSVSVTTTLTANSVVDTSQSQSVSGTAQNGIDSSVGTSQGQSSQATANGFVDSVIDSAQGQTVSAVTEITIDATASTAQAHSVEVFASGDEPVQLHEEQTTYPDKKKKKSLGGHYWKPEELATIEPLVTRLPIHSEPEELPPIAPKPRINRLDTFASAHSALAEIGIHYKQSPIDYSGVINVLQTEIQQQQDDDMAIATLVAMLI